MTVEVVFVSVEVSSSTFLRPKMPSPTPSCRDIFVFVITPSEAAVFRRVDRRFFLFAVCTAWGGVLGNVKEDLMTRSGTDNLS